MTDLEDFIVQDVYQPTEDEKLAIAELEKKGLVAKDWNSKKKGIKSFNPTLPFAPRFLRCISNLTMAVCVTVYYRFCLS